MHTEVLFLKKFFTKNKKLSVFVCLLFLVFSLCIIEFCCYFYYQKYYLDIKEPINQIISQYDHYLPTEYNINNLKRKFRIQNGSDNKGSILFLGSFALNGHGLKRQQTLPYKIHKLTDRTTYKYSNDDWSITNIYHLFISDYIKNTVKNPEYIIFFFSSQDLDCMFKRQIDPYRTYMNKRYKLVDDEFIKEIKNRFLILNSLYIVKTIQIFTEENDLREEWNGDLDLFTAYAAEIINKVKKDFPINTPKFVFLTYNYSFDEEKTEELEEMGFIILDANALTNCDLGQSEFFESQEYYVPNEKTYDIIAKALVQHFNL